MSMQKVFGFKPIVRGEQYQNNEPGTKTAMSDGYIVALSERPMHFAFLSNDSWADFLQSGVLGVPINNYKVKKHPINWIFPQLRTRLSVYIAPVAMSECVTNKLKRTLSYYLSKEFGGMSISMKQGGWVQGADVQKEEYEESYEFIDSINIMLTVMPGQGKRARDLIKEICARSVSFDKSLGNNPECKWVHIDEDVVFARHMKISDA